jgi:DNA helicase II / ATP-dependent DNA helicase PcrA
MDAANLIIGMLKNDRLIKAKPVFRHGDPVRLIRTNGIKSIAENISALIEENCKSGFNSIAIICKTIEECKEIFKAIKAGTREISLITGKEDEYKGGIVVVPTYLSKGLEFDTVIVLNAEDFSDSELDIKLMYVAMTRALHRLYISYCEETGILIKELKKHF